MIATARLDQDAEPTTALKANHEEKLLRTTSLKLVRYTGYHLLVRNVVVNNFDVGFTKKKKKIKKICQ